MSRNDLGMCVGIAVRNRQVGGWSVISTRLEIVAKYLDNGNVRIRGNAGERTGFVQLRQVGITSADASRLSH